MAGNELEVATFLFRNIGKIELNHLGILHEIGAPRNSGGYTVINRLEELSLLSTEDAGKKADIYINGIGVSIKQSGGSFPYNRLQRAEILKVFELLGFQHPNDKLNRIDKEVDDFHHGLIRTRARPWRNLFEECDFKRLLRFLMMEGSPNRGISSHPAQYILEAPSSGMTCSNVHLHDFEDYFDAYKDHIYFSIRRQWIGQISNSEHNRALGLARKPGNQPWVYASIAGAPRNVIDGTIWRENVPIADRRTVYLIFFEKA